MLGRALSQGLSLGRLAFQGHRIVSQARNRGSSRQGLHLSLLQLLLPASNQGLSHLLHFSVFPTSAASPLAFYCKSVSFFTSNLKKTVSPSPTPSRGPAKVQKGQVLVLSLGAVLQLGCLPPLSPSYVLRSTGPIPTSICFSINDPFSHSPDIGPPFPPSVPVFVSSTDSSASLDFRNVTIPPPQVPLEFLSSPSQRPAPQLLQKRTSLPPLSHISCLSWAQVSWMVILGHGALRVDSSQQIKSSQRRQARCLRASPPTHSAAPCPGWPPYRLVLSAVGAPVSRTQTLVPWSSPSSLLSAETSWPAPRGSGPTTSVPQDL